MFGFDDLDIPLIAAPMAGGPSTPALVTALAVAGGFGLLAAGYKTADAVRSEIETVRRSTDRFGVNVFVGNDDPLPTSLDAYAAVLAPLAASLGVEVPRPVPDDDGWDAKIDLLL